MSNEKRKEQYVVGLDYPPEKQSRLKRLVGVWGFKSVRAFIVRAIDEKIERCLAEMLPEDRATIEKMMEGDHA